MPKSSHGIGAHATMGAFQISGGETESRNGGGHVTICP